MKKILLLALIFSSLTQAADVYRCQKETRLSRDARIEDDMFPSDFHFSRGERTYNEFINLRHDESTNKVVLTLSQAPLVCLMDIDNKDSSLSRCGLKSQIGTLSQSSVKQYFQKPENGFDASEVALGLNQEFVPNKIYIYYDSAQKKSLGFREYRLVSLSQKYNCEANMAVDHSEGTPDKPNNAIGSPRGTSTILETGAIQK